MPCAQDLRRWFYLEALVTATSVQLLHIRSHLHRQAPLQGLMYEMGQLEVEIGRGLWAKRWRMVVDKEPGTDTDHEEGEQLCVRF